MLIDTHGHVNFNAFGQDADTVLKRALENNTWVIMPGTQYSTSKRAVELAERYDTSMYAAVGLHPIHLGEQRRVDVLEVQSEIPRQTQDWMTFATKAEEFDYEKYRALAQSTKVVAVGECGLDYYYEPKSKAKREAMRLKQKSTLALHLRLAEEMNLPVILHCRKAHDDLLEFLYTKYQPSPRAQAEGILNTKLRGVVHCYTGTLAQAEKFYEMGLYFGFNCLIFKNVPALPSPKEVIGALPLERIVLETDSPYLAPSIALAKEGLNTERNEPLFVKYVAEEIARIKGISVEEVASVTTSNAQSLFGLLKT